MVVLNPSRRLLARLRRMLGSGEADLPALVEIVASEMVSEACAIYGMRGGEILELRAAYGLRAGAVGVTRLRVGQGLIGLVAATSTLLNLADAQNHPNFAYRPETGEEKLASFLGVPVRRAGRLLGVLSVQNRAARRYSDDEVELLETVAMLLAETLASGGLAVEDEFSATVSRQFTAAVLAPGIAIGPAIVLGAASAPARMVAEDPAAELVRLSVAMETMRRGLDRLIETRQPDGEAPREVLAATRLFATDEGWVRRVGDAVRGGLTAEAAVHRVANDLRDRMRRVADPYMRERLADLEDLAARVLAALGGGGPDVSVVPGGILVARRLGPAQLLEWHARGIAGFVLEEGSAGGHAAIMARALGLPALGNARGLLDAVSNGDDLVLDANDATLVLRPPAELREAYCQAMADRAARQAGQGALRAAPSTTHDGVEFHLFMNAGLPLELDQMEATGAEGIGLFRTEIAMMARGLVLDVPEQAAIYARVMDVAGDRPVHFRTLDLGADKLLPDHPQGHEENPAMGWRSIRVGLDRPALLRRQLRALLLGARGRALSVMFPMVANLAEFRAARALLYAEAARVRPAPATLAVGTMLEVPALLWQLPELMSEADFVSIGSNDLLQFIFAADRGTAGLAERYDFLSVPMLSLLQNVVEQAKRSNVSLSLCGEAASRPIDAMVLLALGIDRLSMSASSLLAVKEALLGSNINAFRPVLATIRRTGAGYSSLREQISGWAREHKQGLLF